MEDLEVNCNMMMLYAMSFHILLRAGFFSLVTMVRLASNWAFRRISKTSDYKRLYGVS